MKVIITGSTGLVGSALVRSLLADGHGVTRLVRGGPQTFSAPGTSAVRRDPRTGGVYVDAPERHASAVGFYGDRGEEVLTEESASGDDFLSDVCREWEKAALPASQAGIRVVNV